ncbi:MAG: universal stress protein [Thermodesulfovibrionia bacterium]
MPIEKILFPTKFGELSFNALESLLVLKGAGLKEVVLLYVIPREDVGFVPFGGYLKKEEERLRNEARIRFEDWQKSLTDVGIRGKIIINVGDIIHEILDTSEREGVDLVVIGRKKRITDEGIFITGNITSKVISRSKTPLLVSKYMVQFKWDEAILTKVNDHPLELPMLVVDWSGISERAVRFFMNLKGAVSKALVFHCIDVNTSDEVDKITICHEEEECKKRLDDYCKMLKSAGIDAEPHLGAGDTVEEVLRFSRERDASMIIMGTTGRGKLDELLHGSISHEVAKRSELPTLLVP